MKIIIKDNGYNQQKLLLEKKVKERIPVVFSDAGMYIELNIDSNIGAAESYRIDNVKRGWLITGSDALGLYFGIGKFLHSAKWTSDDFKPNPTPNVITPGCSYRTIYFSVHFYNWYQMASVEELEQYMEELMLWGYNAIHCIIPVLNFYSFEDELFWHSVKVSRKLFLMAKHYGMKTSFGIIPNQGLLSAPHEFDADLSYDPVGNVRGYAGRNLCPSKPGAVDYLRGLWIKMLEQYQDIGLDYIQFWPYDEGGCGCNNCRPWGAKGYCDLCMEVRKEVMKFYPQAKYVLSCWTFDEAYDEGEFKGLYARLKGDMDWVDYIMVDCHGAFPSYPLENEVIKPVVNFPEISMWRLYPWGGYGANPLPKRFQEIWDSAKHILQGGQPYSEGIFEDISKIQCVGYYWEPDKHYRDILGEYINYEYRGAEIEKVLELMELIEENHVRVGNGQIPILESALRAAEIAKSIDMQLCEHSKNSWRWRILYIRAMLDKKRYAYFLEQGMTDEVYLSELHRFAGDFLIEDQEAQAHFKELRDLYHCVEFNHENQYTLPPLNGGTVWNGMTYEMKRKKMNRFNVGLYEAELSDITATGWMKRYLDTQAKGLTGHMDEIGGPFAKRYWGNYSARNIKESNDVFLGGLQAEKVSWVPFEQTGYWIDGMIRCGYLSKNKELTDKARSYIYDVINQVDNDGYLGPDFLKDDTIWAHAVFFRAMVAEYSASHDERVLNALKKHFLRCPMADVFHKFKGGPMIGMRNIADTEIALWIYGETGDARFLKMAEDSYACFNEKYQDEKPYREDSKCRDVTVPGMLGQRKLQRTHGVTYNEVCKIAAIMYKYTGKDVYKQASINAFDKVYRDQMLVDGLHSSTEYFNGNESSTASHETCDVSDFSWAVGYLYMITGDSKYGDWIEDCIFNAGLGSVDDDFKGQQYFSCPNQVICDDVSNHNLFYRGSDWMSYAPKEFLCCCAGNVHRFMPNYLARSWMTDGKDGIYATLYTPSEFRCCIDGNEFLLKEETKYPFEHNVTLVIESEKSVAFTLYLRDPNWSVNTCVKINGQEFSCDKENGFFVIHRTFFPDDLIEICFHAEIKLIESARGISLKYGPLLYALPIGEKVVVEGLREQNNEEFPHYSLYPESKWNYGLDMSRKDEIRLLQQRSGEEPWRAGCGGSEIEVPVREVNNWKIINVKKGKKRLLPREHVHHEIGHQCLFTPVVKANIKEENKGKQERIVLVPYCTTRLRIAIFPKV